MAIKGVIFDVGVLYADEGNGGHKSSSDCLAAANREIRTLARHSLPATHRYWPGRRESSRTLIEANIDSVRALRPGYKTAVLSNDGGRLRDRLHELGIACLFDIVVDAAEELWQKPDPRVYLLTLARLGLEPSEAVFVETDMEHIEAARSVGATGVVYDRDSDDLRELLQAAGAEMGVLAR